MNKNPLFSARPSPGIRFRNLHFASWNSFSAAIVSLLFVALSPCLAVQSCTLAWDTISDPNVSGYKLRYGTTRGNPSQSIDVGKTTTWTVSNLNDATTYCFTLVAYNTAGVESQTSNQVSYTTSNSATDTYLLTVNSGSGGGNYAVGTQVQVNANPPSAGQAFATWTGDYQILANPSSPTTTATMPSLNATITATYKGEDTGAPNWMAPITESLVRGQNNDGHTFVKAIDGNVSRFFNAPTDTGYVGIDTGSGGSSKLTSI